MEQLNEILTEVNGMLWGWPMIILLLGTHLFLTIRRGTLDVLEIHQDGASRV